jgi:hypothetical protein
MAAGQQNARPRFRWTGVFSKGSLTITYFHTGNPHYHRRGVVSRSCSGWEGVVPTRYGHQAKRGVVLHAASTARAARRPIREEALWKVMVAGLIGAAQLQLTHWIPSKRTSYRIKPYGQLVSVSLTHYCASTPDLSTSWS